MAPPSPQVAKAFQAMTAIGLTEQQIKSVLKNLLKLYNKDWSLIEAEEYRALADAIFQAEEAKAAAEKKKRNNFDEDVEADAVPHNEFEVPLTRLCSRSQDKSSSQKKKSADDELMDNIEEDFLVPHRPLKRLRLQNKECQVSPSSNACNPMSDGTSLIGPKLEADELLDTHSAKLLQNTSQSPESSPPVSPQSCIKKKGQQPLISKPLALQGKSISERSSNGVHFKETVVEPGIILLPKQNINSLALFEPKNEPFTDDMAQDEVSIVVIHPDESDHVNPLLSTEGATGNQHVEAVASQERESRNDTTALSNEESMNNELATIQECSTSNLGESSCLEVASSPSGEVKLSLSCSSASRRPGFHMPNLDAILKLSEEKCLHTYRITDPKISLKNLLGQMCESFFELATKSNDESQDGSMKVAPNLDSLQKSPAWDAVSGNKETLSMRPCALNGPIIMDCPSAVTDPEVPRVPFPLNNDSPQVSGTIGSNGFSEDNIEDFLSLVVVQNADLIPDVLSCRITGTTTMALIGNDVIHLASDQRCTEKDQPDAIDGDNFDKFFPIDRDIIGTISGDYWRCHGFLKSAHDIVSAFTGFPSSYRVLLAARLVMASIDRWERNSKEICTDAVIIVGWRDGVEPQVYTITSKQIVPGGILLESHLGYVSATGSGAEYAIQFFNEFVWQYHSDKEYGHVVELAIAAAAMKCAKTGGHVSTAAVSRGGGYVVHNQAPPSVLQILERDDRLLSHLLLKSLFFVCYNLEYNSCNEAKLKEFLDKRFPRSESHVISMNNGIIRVINFVNAVAASRAWKEVGEQGLHLVETGGSLYFFEPNDQLFIRLRGISGEAKIY